MTTPRPDPARLLGLIRAGEGPYERISAGDGTSGWCERGLPAAVRGEFIRSGLQWDDRGEMLKRGSRTTVREIEVEGTPFVLKQYKLVALRRRLRYAVMRTRSQQSWEQGRLMAALGLRVARPLAILLERRGGIPGRSALLMEAVRGDSLRHLVESGERWRLEAALPHLAEAFEQMAGHHLIHGDLSGSNILLDGDNRPTFIDFDGSRHLPSERRFRRAWSEERISFLKNFRGYPELEKLFGDLL